MDKYQFRIGDVIIQNPEGWKEFELRLKRDDDIAGLLVSSTNKFTFWGDGYDELKQRFDDNYNDKVSADISILQSDNTYKEQYTGVIIITEVTFNLEKRFAEATIEDANFQGAIQNNKNVKTFLNAGLTKNGEITTALTIFNLDYFIGAFYQSLANRRSYLLKDALDFLVRFMTDDLVKGVQSAYLDDVNNFEGASVPYITTGISIRLSSQAAPNVSFFQLIQFLQRTHDLTFDFVTNLDGDPVMRIEEKAFFFQSTNSDTIRDIVDLSVKVDSERIYSHLEVGNNNAFDSGNCSITTRWFSFQKEDYSLRGKGNKDKLLDLTTDFTTDSNVIEEIVVNSNTDLDDNIIIVLGNIAGNQATRFRTTEYCSNLFFYNQGFTNDNIIARQLNSIPNSVTKYLTAATTLAKAEAGFAFQRDFGPTPAQTTISIGRNHTINFSDEKYDLGSNYDTSDPNNTFYDVPFAGDFSFDVSIQTTFVLDSLHNPTAFTVADLAYQISIQRFDSTFTTLKEQVFSNTVSFILGGSPAFEGKFINQVRTLQATMTCDTGDRIIAQIITVLHPSVNIALLVFRQLASPSTFFKCLGAATDAGTFKVFDPNSFRAKLYRFEKNLSLTRTDNIIANRRGSIVINESSDTNLDKTTWIEEMVNNIETGKTSFVMIK